MERQREESQRHPVLKRAPRVLVVGAGFAGVAAAGTLREGGIHDVILLEACDRPGGRAKTVVLDKGFIEHGAQFLHGRHAVYQIAEREGMLEEDSDDEELPDTLLLFKKYVFQTSEGKTVSDHIVQNNLQVFEDLMTDAMRAGRELGQASDVSVSLGHFYGDRLQTVRTAMLGTEHLKTAMLGWFAYWGCLDCASKWDQHSLAGCGQFTDAPGSGSMVTTKGMEAVLRCLLRDSLPPERLHVSKPVRAVFWTASKNNQTAGKLGINTETIILPNENQCAFNGNLATEKSEKTVVWERNDERTNGILFPVDETREIEEDKTSVNVYRFPEDDKTADDSDDGRTKDGFKVRIECEDGDVFYADHVIVTSSVGYLAHNPSFFQPPLPEAHQKAISSTGFGNVAKMFLFWDEQDLKAMKIRPNTKASDWKRALFGETVHGMITLWLPDANTQLKSAKYSTKMSNGNHWYQELVMLGPAHSHEFCLVAWLAGQAAVVMESLPESEVKDVLYELLVLFLNKPDLPAPRWFTRTMWHNNPYTRGAYSYPATHVPLEMRDVLTHPVPSVENPVIQLAGEACSKHYFSTVHGALLSGQDAARMLLRHYNSIQ